MRVFSVLCTALAIGAIASADVLSHWTFDERGGVTAADSVGGLDGALLGSASFSPGSGVSGGAVELSRVSNDVVSFGDAYPLTGDVNRSISVWVRTSDVVNDTFVVARHRSTQLAGWILLLNTTACYGETGKASGYFTASCGQDPTSTSTVTDDTWHHIVLTYDAGGSGVIFIDGNEEASLPVPLVGGTTADLLLGGIMIGSSPTGFYNGLVDDLQIYDHTVTESQASSMFDHPGQTLPPCPVDLSHDGRAGFDDLLQVLSAWGCTECPEDVDASGMAGFGDILAILSSWDDCPGIE